MRQSWFYKTAVLATCIAVIVVLLGAYTRLSDAGLGCPDWPGCYGHIDVPKTQDEISKATQAFPDRPVEAHKAWKEMIHRYFAGSLGLLIFALAIMAWRRRHENGQAVKLPLFLAGFVIFQALLGMWTVTIKLNPTIVMLHLMGGLTTLSCLLWLVLRSGKHWRVDDFSQSRLSAFSGLALTGLIIVVIQIMLGGWTSANYAALACGNDFPTCMGAWLPSLDFSNALTLWHGTERNFEFGILENDARITIQFMHRVGALVTLLFLCWLIVKLWASQVATLRKLAVFIGLVLAVQITLGILNVVLLLPLPNAVAHNGVGALLLLSMVMLNHAVRPTTFFNQH